MTGLHGPVLLPLIFLGAWARPSPCERKKKGKHVMASECHSGSRLLQAYLHGNQGWQLYGIHICLAVSLITLTLTLSTWGPRAGENIPDTLVSSLSSLTSTHIYTHIHTW